MAQPFNDRYPPHTLAVDRSPRPAYVVQAGVETFRAWLEATRRHGSGGRGRRVPHLPRLHAAARRPSLARSAFTVRTSAGRGEAASLLDAQARHRVVERPGPGRLGLDRGGPRCRAPGERGDARERPRRARPGRPGGDGRERRRRAESGGRARPPGCRGPLGERRDPDHAEPDADRALRAGGHPARPARREGAARTLERGGAVPAGPRASGVPARCRRRARRRRAGDSRTRDRRGRRSCATTRRCVASPDDPAGYEAFARLTTLLRASVRSPLEYAARLADLGLLTDARAAYADAARALGPERVHVELWRLRARLAAADGDARGSVPARRRGGRGARAGPAGRRRDGRPGRARGLRRPAASRSGPARPWSSRPTGASTGRPGAV